MNSRTVVGMYVAFFSLGLIGNVLGPTLPAIRAEFGIGLEWAGTLFTVQFVGGLLATWIAGYLSDIVGRKPLLVAGAVLLSGGVLVFAAATPEAVWLMPAGAALFGAGFGSLDAAANAVINERFGGESGSAMNRMHAFFGAGSLVGPLITGAVLTLGHTWRVAYAAAAVFPLLYLVLIARGAFGAVPTTGSGASAGARSGGAAVAGADDRDDHQSTTALLADRRFVVLALTLFVYVGVEVGASGWSVTFMEKEFAQSAGVASGTLSLFWLAVTLGRLVHQRLAQKVSYGALMAIGGFGAAAALAVVALGSSALVAAAGFILTGLFLSGIFPIGLGLGGRIFPSNFGAVSGSLIAAGSLGGALLPPIVGFLGAGIGLREGIGFLLVLAVLVGSFSIPLGRWEGTGAKRLPRAS